MAIHKLQAKQLIPISQEKGWDFFSDPRNLSIITPPWLRLKIRDVELLPKKIYEGMILTYDVSPFPYLEQTWVTEITHIREGSYFVDEQRAGPYAIWHHEHFLHPTDEGIVAEDLIHYKLPLGFLGDLAGKDFVLTQLKKVFSFRAEKIKQLYPGSKTLLLP